MSYTPQFLHKPIFTQANFYTNTLLQQTLFVRNPLSHQPVFTQTRFYTNSFFHKPSFTQTSSYTNKLLHAPVSTQINFSANQFYTNHVLHQPTCTNLFLHKYKSVFYTNPFLHKPTFGQITFCAHQPAIHNPCFGPVGQRPEGRQNAGGCNNKWLEDITRSFAHPALPWKLDSDSAWTSGPESEVLACAVLDCACIFCFQIFFCGTIWPTWGLYCGIENAWKDTKNQRIA